MATVQETIDNLISYIDAAVAKHSVSNRHVATVLAFFNEWLKSLSSKYLSKTEDDTAGGFVTFLKGLLSRGDVTVEGRSVMKGSQEVFGLQTLHEGFETPGFSNVAGRVKGAQLTKNGVLTVAGVIAQSYEIFEFIYNKIRAQGGRATFSDTATIESCVYAMDEAETTILTPAEFYEQHKGVSNEAWNDAVNSIHHVILVFKKSEENNDSVPFENGDIIYGYVNRVGESGQYARGGVCSMNIITEDDDINRDGFMVVRANLSHIVVDSDNPEFVAVNMPPTEGMVVAQNGNVNGKEGRTTSFFIDSEAGHIIMLQNVTTPTVTAANYAVISGLLPADLLAKVQKHFSFVKPTTPVLYARYGIFENFLQLDHDGEPIKTERDRGAWSAEAAVENPYVGSNAKDVGYYDTVTHGGSKWKCLVDRTTEEPSAGSTHWLLIVAKGDDGVSATLYRLIPSTTELVQSENGENTPAQITFDVSKIVGGTATAISDSEKSRLKVLYYVDDLYEGNKQYDTIQIDTAGIQRGVDATLYLDGVIVDFVSVLVKRDGKTGPAGADGNDGADGADGIDGLSPQPNLIQNSNFDLTVSEGITPSLISSRYGEYWVKLTRYRNTNHYAMMKYFNDKWNARYEPFVEDHDGLYWCFVGTSDSFKIYNKATGHVVALTANASSGAACTMVVASSAVSWSLTTNSNGTYSIVTSTNRGLGINSYSGLANGGELKLYSAPNDAGSQWYGLPLAGTDKLLYWEQVMGFVENGAYNGFNVYNCGLGLNLSSTTPLLRPDTDYTFSFLYRIEESNIDNLNIALTIGHVLTAENVVTDGTTRCNASNTEVYFNGTAGEWKKAIVTFGHTENTSIEIPFSIFNNTSKGLQIAQLKLEEGADATPYRKNEYDFKGESLKVASIQYAQTSDEVTDPSTLTYSDVVPTPEKGKYIWTQTTYSDGKVDYGVAYVPLDGESVIFADLDNEMDSVGLDAEGNADADYTIRTNVSLYNGATKMVLTSLTATLVEGSGLTQETANKDTGVVEYTVSKGTAVSSRNVISITLVSGDVERVLTLTVNGVKQGVDGEPAKIYKIRPNVNQVIKKKDGTFQPANVSCIGSLIVDGEEQPNASGITLRYYKDGSSTSTSYISNTVIASSTFKQIKFELLVNGVVQDVETISVVEDGSDGDDGRTPNENLLLNTNFDVFEDNGTTLKHWTTQNGSITKEGFEGFKVFSPIYELGTAMPTLEAGKTYTFSFYYKTTNATGNLKWIPNVPFGDIVVGSSDNCPYNPADNRFYLRHTDNTWQQAHFTFKCTSAHNTTIGFLFLNDSYGLVYVSRIKLEEGDAPTAYQKHPEDLIGEDGKDGLSPQPNLIINSNFDILADGGEENTVSVASFQSLSSSYGEQWINVRNAHHTTQVMLVQSAALNANALYRPNIPFDTDGAKWCFVGTINDFVIYNKYAGRDYILGLDGSNNAVLVDKSLSFIHRWRFEETSTGESIVYNGKNLGLNPYGGHANGGNIALYNFFNNTSSWNLFAQRTVLSHWSEQHGHVIPNGYEDSNVYALNMQASGDTSYCLSQTTPKLQPNVEYTFSFLYRISNLSEESLGLSWDIDYDFVSNGNIKTDDNEFSLDDSHTIVTFRNNTGSWEKARVTFKHTDSTERSFTFVFIVGDLPTHITRLKLEASSKPTPYRKAESDLTGPAGEAGTAMYPLGDWVKDVLYTRTAKSAPFIYYDADTTDGIEGSYYMLKAMQSIGQKPSEHPDVWEPVTGQRALHVKFLMANFALFGSNNGAVFYDRYLFSQRGRNTDGNDAYYGDYIDTMFNADGTLSGVFTPNVLLDFLSGRFIATNATLRGHIDAISGRFAGELVGATGTFINGVISCGDNFRINRDGSGCFAKDRFSWTSVGELYSVYQIEPLWLNISKMCDSGKFVLLEGTDVVSDRIYSGICISLVNYGQFFDMNRYDLADGTSPENVLLIERPSISKGYSDLYRIAPRNEAYFWGDGDSIYFLQAHASNRFEFVGFGTDGTSKVLSVGDRVLPRKGIRAKLVFDGERWVGQASEWRFFIL